MSGGNARPGIEHVVVLMMENRSFDCMLGRLYPSGAAFDGLRGNETNNWHTPDGTVQPIAVWTENDADPSDVCVPDPDPGELFEDIRQQLNGLASDAAAIGGLPTMAGFVDNYMRQPAGEPPPTPSAVMHYFTDRHVPVISQLARAFGVSDRWHASAPCQTWPNRFFVHTGTADGYVNNAPEHVPFLMETVFDRVSAAGFTWRIYFHDIPQTAALGRLWPHFTSFRLFDDAFEADAAAGDLPTYSFIEPRYFADVVGNHLPNDEHPPHNVAYGEDLIAKVYNALRAGPGWKQTLLIVTYDEHGGCFDHVPPPRAAPPGGQVPDGFAFDTFGVRVPAVIVSPYIEAGSILRPPGETPFDHTSIFKTLQELFGLSALTPRSDAAPGLLATMTSQPENDGPEAVRSFALPADAAKVALAAARPQNGLQRSLSKAAVQLPTAGADVAAHITRVTSSPLVMPEFATVEEAAKVVASSVRAFLGAI